MFKIIKSVTAGYESSSPSTSGDSGDEDFLKSLPGEANNKNNIAQREFTSTINRKIIFSKYKTI